MLRKLILTETEKKQISSLHRLLNEDDGFATLQGYVKYKASKSPNSQVKLFQNEKLIKGATSDENGFFKIENIPLGVYTYKVTNKNEGYEDLEENIDLSQPKVYNEDFTFMDTHEFEEVAVSVKANKRTFLDVSVFDSDVFWIAAMNFLSSLIVKGFSLTFAPFWSSISSTLYMVVANWYPPWIV